MQLFYSPTSPYVRKVSILAMETGLWDRIERVAKTVTPITREAAVAAKNPLAKVPTLITDDGVALYDSRVICEYLDGLHAGPKMFPAAGAARFAALTQQALGDGLLDAALLVRYEGFLRPEEKRWPEWSDGQLGKVKGALAEMNGQAGAMGSRIDIGAITFACAIGYLDFRFADMNWRAEFPALAAWYAQISARPSLKATVPAA